MFKSKKYIILLSVIFFLSCDEDGTVFTGTPDQVVAYDNTPGEGLEYDVDSVYYDFSLPDEVSFEYYKYNQTDLVGTYNDNLLTTQSFGNQYLFAVPSTSIQLNQQHVVSIDSESQDAQSCCENNGINGSGTGVFQDDECTNSIAAWSSSTEICYLLDGLDEYIFYDTDIISEANAELQAWLSDGNSINVSTPQEFVRNPASLTNQVLEISSNEFDIITSLDWDNSFKYTFDSEKSGIQTSKYLYSQDYENIKEIALVDVDLSPLFGDIMLLDYEEDVSREYTIYDSLQVPILDLLGNQVCDETGEVLMQNTSAITTRRLIDYYAKHNYIELNSIIKRQSTDCNDNYQQDDEEIVIFSSKSIDDGFDGDASTEYDNAKAYSFQEWCFLGDPDDPTDDACSDNASLSKQDCCENNNGLWNFDDETCSSYCSNPALENAADCCGLNGGTWQDPVCISCSDGVSDTQQTCCESNGGLWSNNNCIEHCSNPVGSSIDIDYYDGFKFNPCDLPINNIYLSGSDVWYSIDFELSSFQWSLEGANATGASGGDAELAGFTIEVDGASISSNENSGVTIQPGCGLLTTLTYDVTPTNFNDIVFAAVSDTEEECCNNNNGVWDGDEETCIESCSDGLSATQELCCENNGGNWDGSNGCISYCTDDISGDEALCCNANGGFWNGSSCQGFCTDNNETNEADCCSENGGFWNGSICVGLCTTNLAPAGDGCSFTEEDCCTNNGGEFSEGVCSGGDGTWSLATEQWSISNTIWSFSTSNWLSQTENWLSSTATWSTQAVWNEYEATWDDTYTLDPENSLCETECITPLRTITMRDFCWDYYDEDVAMPHGTDTSGHDRLTGSCYVDQSDSLSYLYDSDGDYEFYKLAFCDRGNNIYDQKEFYVDGWYDPYIENNQWDEPGEAAFEAEPFEDRNCNNRVDNSEQLAYHSNCNIGSDANQNTSNDDSYTSDYCDVGNRQWDNVEKYYEDAVSSDYTNLYTLSQQPNNLLINYSNYNFNNLLDPIALTKVTASGNFFDTGEDGCFDALESGEDNNGDGVKDCICEFIDSNPLVGACSDLPYVSDLDGDGEITIVDVAASKLSPYNYGECTNGFSGGEEDCCDYYGCRWEENDDGPSLSYCNWDICENQTKHCSNNIAGESCISDADCLCGPSEIDCSDGGECLVDKWVENLDPNGDNYSSSNSTGTEYDHLWQNTPSDGIVNDEMSHIYRLGDQTVGYDSYFASQSSFPGYQPYVADGDFVETMLKKYPECIDADSNNDDACGGETRIFPIADSLKRIIVVKSNPIIKTNHKVYSKQVIDQIDLASGEDLNNYNEDIEILNLFSSVLSEHNIIKTTFTNVEGNPDYDYLLFKKGEGAIVRLVHPMYHFIPSSSNNPPIPMDENVYDENDFWETVHLKADTILYSYGDKIVEGNQFYSWSSINTDSSNYSIRKEYNVFRDTVTLDHGVQDPNCSRFKKQITCNGEIFTDCSSKACEEELDEESCTELSQTNQEQGCIWNSNDNICERLCEGDPDWDSSFGNGVYNDNEYESFVDDPNHWTVGEYDGQDWYWCSWDQNVGDDGACVSSEITNILDCLKVRRKIIATQEGTGLSSELISDTYLKPGFRIVKQDISIFWEHLPWVTSSPVGISTIEYKRQLPSSQNGTNGFFNDNLLNANDVENMSEFDYSPFRITPTMGLQRLEYPPNE